MNSKRFPVTASLGLFVLILALLGSQTATSGQALPADVAGSPVGTAFTYQGQLQSGGTPVDDTCDFEFGLWDAPTGGNLVGSPQPAPNIPVNNGLFAVRLDFGSGAFTGEGRWLQTAVRCPAGSGEYTTLAPRQALNPVPYAMLSEDLSLPFAKEISSTLAAIDVRNDGDGSALYASTNGSGNVLHVNAYGSGAAVAAWSFGSNEALGATNRGTGDAAYFKIDNPDNASSLIDSETNGLGAGASIRINNTLNDQPALYASTDGSGNVVHVNAFGSGSAVSGWSFGSGWAATFSNEGSGGGVYISSGVGTTGLTVSGGSKNAVVPTSGGARLLYSEEATEVWFTDYGFGQLAGGSVFITIDPLFAETVNLQQPYHVFVQAYGDAEL